MNAYDRYSARARNWAVGGASLILLGVAHGVLSIWAMLHEAAGLTCYGAATMVICVGASFTLFERASYWRARASNTIKHMPIAWRKL